MKITKSLIPLVLVGSVALAGQSGGQTAPKTAQHKAPLSMDHPSTTPAPSTTLATEPKAGKEMSDDAAKAESKAKPTISKEQAAKIATETMKGSTVASSELKEVGGRQVWTVNLTEGKKHHEVMVDAASGSILKQEPKHTKHHDTGAEQPKH